MGADEVVEAARDGDLGEEMWEQVEVMEVSLRERFSWRFLHFNVHHGALGPVLDFGLCSWSLHPQLRCPI